MTKTIAACQKNEVSKNRITVQQKTNWREEGQRVPPLSLSRRACTSLLCEPDERFRSGDARPSHPYAFPLRLFVTRRVAPPS